MGSEASGNNSYNKGFQQRNTKRENFDYLKYLSHLSEDTAVTERPARNLKGLETIQTLRLSLDAFNATPVESLYGKLNYTPL